MDPVSIDRKTWRKLSWIEQGYLTKHYEVILLDYWVNPIKLTLDKITPLITIKNIQKGIRTVSNGIDKFSKATDEFKIFPDGQGIEGIVGKHTKHTDFSKLAGKKKEFPKI